MLLYVFEVLFILTLADALKSIREKSTPNLGALWNLEKMAECRLGYSALAYNNYGCWCGVGGSDTPVDEIDECCQRHDQCYDFAADQHFCFDIPEEYVDDYSWSCKLNTTKTDPRKEPLCAEGQSECQQHLCWCDKTVIDCWSQYPRPDFKKTCSHIEPNTTKVLDRRDESSAQPGSAVIHIYGAKGLKTNKILVVALPELFFVIAFYRFLHSDFYIRSDDREIVATTTWSITGDKKMRFALCLLVLTAFCPAIFSLLCQICEGDSCNYPAGAGYVTEACAWSVQFCYKLANVDHNKVFKAGCGYEECESIPPGPHTKCLTCNYDNCNGFDDENHAYIHRLGGGGTAWNGSIRNLSACSTSLLIAIISFLALKMSL
ncbi:phospholipase a2 domain-containing protein [Ditylenchus destructor]|uniref:Phospholipase A2 n=1 Tax=Ditylenchus destructor TaxID=166010 RepID=A0AAD4NHV8_9BILA|nr:phospholipase a2 domain-containing protein [Ditylenchus destructor]